MTPDELHNLTDEQLRIEIAKALGATIHGNPKGNWSLRGPNAKTWARKDRGRPFCFPGYPSQIMPNWPASIADAWTLFLELRAKDCDIALASCGDAWCIGWSSGVDGKLCKLAERAICEAWLLFKMEAR